MLKWLVTSVTAAAGVVTILVGWSDITEQVGPWVLTPTTTLLATVGVCAVLLLRVLQRRRRAKHDELRILLAAVERVQRNTKDTVEFQNLKASLERLGVDLLKTAEDYPLFRDMVQRGDIKAARRRFPYDPNAVQANTSASVAEDMLYRAATSGGTIAVMTALTGRTIWVGTELFRSERISHREYTVAIDELNRLEDAGFLRQTNNDPIHENCTYEVTQSGYAYTDRNALGERLAAARGAEQADHERSGR